MYKGVAHEMSKRRNRRTQPNLPDDVLARARREAGIENAPAETTDEVVPVPARRSREQLPQPRVQRRKRPHGAEPEALTGAEIAELLAHPTKHVTEDEMRQHYGYVLNDLRSMGALAGLLFVIMIVVARLL